MAELNYDPRIPAEPTSWWWKTIRFVIITLWIVMGLLAVRHVMLDAHPDVDDSSASASALISVDGDGS